MKKILIPTDFSGCADAAFKVGLALAEKFKAEIHLLHIINSAYDWKKVPKDLEKNHPDIVKKIGQARAKLGAMTHTAKSHNVKATEFIAFNKSYLGIVEHAEQFGNDFLVMGTYGTKGVKRIIGSTAQHVIRYCPVPALIVKEQHLVSKLKHITFASAFEDVPSAQLKLLKEIQAGLNLRTSFLTVNTPQNFEDTKRSLKKMKDEVSLFMAPGDELTIYNSLSIPTGIMRFNNTSGNLVFVECHQRSGIEQLFNASITEYLVTHGSSMVLSFPHAI